MKYARQRETAKRLIGNHGMTVTVIEKGNENSDWLPSSSTDVSHETNAVFFTITRTKYETAKLAGYDLTGSVYAIIPAFGYVIKPGDQIIRSGVVMSVEYVDVMAVNEELIYSEVYIKGDVPASIEVI